MSSVLALYVAISLPFIVCIVSCVHCVLEVFASLMTTYWLYTGHSLLEEKHISTVNRLEKYSQNELLVERFSGVTKPNFHDLLDLTTSLHFIPSEFNHYSQISQGLDDKFHTQNNRVGYMW